MARATHLYVFAYDVERDWAREKVAHALEEQLVRVQKSVFEGRLTQDQARRLARRVQAHLAPADSLRVYAVTADGLDASLVVGVPPLPEKHAFMLL